MFIDKYRHRANIDRCVIDLHISIDLSLTWKKIYRYIKPGMRILIDTESAGMLTIYCIRGFASYKCPLLSKV